MSAVDAARIVIDSARCIGAGQCAMTAPAVFDQDEDDGTVVLLDDSPADDLAAVVREAAVLCPSQAIRLQAPSHPSERSQS